MVYSRDGIDGDLDNLDLQKYRYQFRLFDNDLNGGGCKLDPTLKAPGFKL